MARGSHRTRRAASLESGHRLPADLLAAAALLALLLLLFYGKILFGIPGGRAYFWEDFLYQNYPYRSFGAVELRNGSFPFWNPYQFGGMPFVADIQAAALYPPNLLLTLFARDGRLAPIWVEALQIAHTLLGGLFLFLLVRARTACAYAAAVSAAAWAFSGFFVVRMIHGNVLAVVAWAPGIFLLYFVAVERRSLAAAVAAGILFAVSLLGGAPQYSLYLVLLFGLYALYAAARRLSCEAGVRGRLRPFFSLALLLAVGTGLAAVQLLPTEELSRLSLRSEMTYERSTECSCPPAHLATLLLPNLYGSPGGERGGHYWGTGRDFYYWELCGYSGVVVLLLAGLALVYRPRGPLTLFFAIVALFGLLLALGRYGPLHRLFFELLPGYGRFRCPGRALFLTSFALAFLAGLGARLTVTHPPRPKRRSFLVAWILFLLASGTISYLFARPAAAAAVPDAPADVLRAYGLFLAFLLPSAAILLAWAFGRRGLSRPLRALLFLLLAGELFAQGYGFNHGRRDPDSFYRGQKAAIDLLRTEAAGGLYRVKTRAPEGFVLPRNMGSVNRIPSVDGYNQLKLQRYEDLQPAVGFPVDRFLDLFGVRAYASFDRQARALRIVRNENALPKAFLVDEAEVLPAGKRVLERIADSDFDPRRTIVLEGEEEGYRKPGGSGRAAIVSWEANRIEVETESDRPAYLVLTETVYPAWRVSVDGEERPALAADHALRAVRVEAGTHRVLWAYRSGSFRTGLGISLAAAILAAAFLLFLAPRRGDRLADHVTAMLGRCKT